tara:strand:+ start:2518 stop:2838 length:321 start_codon:yes stop_codon:yes gene_type:complete
MNVIPSSLYDRGNVILHCPKCASSFPAALFGWSNVNCISCNTEIKHPSYNAVGYHAHGQDSKQVTVRMATNIVTQLDALANEHGTSRGGMTRYLIQIAMQGRPDAT